MIYGNGGHAKVIREFYDGDGWIIAIGDNAARKREAVGVGGPFGIAIHPLAIISSSATIGAGSVVMAGAIVQAGARIGRHCILNTGCSVDHDCIVEDYAHIAPGARLCGGVHVGEGALIGVGAGIEPLVQIPAWSIVKRTGYSIGTLRGNERL